MLQEAFLSFLPITVAISPKPRGGSVVRTRYAAFSRRITNTIAEARVVVRRIDATLAITGAPLEPSEGSSNGRRNGLKRIEDLAARRPRVRRQQQDDKRGRVA